MAYTADDLILAEHYNIFVSGDGTFGITNPNVANLNTVWGTGFGDKGYGQSTVLAQTSPGATVTAAQWQTLFDRILTADDHQGDLMSGNMPGDLNLVASNALVIGIEYEIVTAGTGDWTTAGAADSNPGTIFRATATTNGQSDGTARQPAVTTGTLIDAIATLQGNVDSIFNNRLTAFATGATSVQAAAGASSWDVDSVHTIEVQFDSPDETRYFFNAGGTIDITASRSGGGSGEDNAAFDQLLPDMNIVRFAAQGTTKVGGAGTPAVEETTIGYYDVSTSPVLVFKQNATGYVGGDANISIEAQTNGPQGVLGDQGDLVTIIATLATNTTVPPGVDGTTTVTVTVNFPETTYLTDVWGTVTFPTVTVVQT